MKAEIKPKEAELEEARKLVSEALEKAEKNLPRETDYTVSIAWTEQEFVLDRMDGTSGRAHSADFLEIKFNTEPEKWRDAIKSTAVHEYAHTWHYEKRYNAEGRNDFVWQYVIDEALTQVFAEKMFDHSPPHRTEHSREEVAGYWSKIKSEEIERSFDGISWPYSLYINKSDSGYPNWLGYSMSYLIGKELLKDHSLEEFPELGKQDLIKAGDRVFNQKGE